MERFSVKLFDAVPSRWPDIIKKRPLAAKYIFSLVGLGYDWTQISLMYALRSIGVKEVKRNMRIPETVPETEIVSSERYFRYLLCFTNGEAQPVEMNQIARSKWLQNAVRELSTVPQEGVCLREIGTYEAAFADNLLDMTLQQWINAANLVLGYSETGDSQLLDSLVRLLYKKKLKWVPVREDTKMIARTAALWWWLSAQKGIARRFPLVFKRIPETQETNNKQEEKSAQKRIKAHIDSVNGMLDALTAGDILKEDAILQQPIERCFQKLQNEQQKNEQTWKKKI